MDEKDEIAFLKEVVEEDKNFDGRLERVFSLVGGLISGLLAYRMWLGFDLGSPLRDHELAAISLPAILLMT